MRTYKVTLDDVSVTGAITLVQLKAGSTAPLVLLRAWCSQRTLTSSAQQRVQIVRKSGAATVTSATPLLLDPGDAASAAVGGTSATGINATAEGTDGDILYHDNFNVLNGWLWVPVPEERVIVPPAGIIGLKFPTAPGSAMNVSAGLIWGEIG